VVRTKDVVMDSSFEVGTNDGVLLITKDMRLLFTKISSSLKLSSKSSNKELVHYFKFNESEFDASSLLEYSITPQELTKGLLALDFYNWPNAVKFDFIDHSNFTNEKIECIVQKRVDALDDISVKLYYSIPNWPHKTTLETFILKLPEILNSEKVTVGRNISREYLHLIIKMEITEGVLSENFEHLFKIIEGGIIQLNSKYEEESFQSTFTKFFNFPSEYSTICSQYLMWFGEFLKNLGIEADVHTEPKSGQTALIVSPKENPELLEEIEKLFYQYLALPYAELLPASKQTPEEVYAYQSAMSQIGNLKNQIQMKDSMLQLQQATNSALTEKLILQANQPLLLESLKDEKKYEFFGGLISIPAKQEFGKNKNISINFEKLFSKK
jgi:hypothetical protein